MVHPLRRLVLPAAEVRPQLDRIRRDLDVPERFPAEVVAEASRATDMRPARADRTDLELVTIDPASSTDLDQALSIEPAPGGGHVVWYAIADVAAFVPDGSLVDLESRQRGVTLYAPDGRSPLHPEVLSEGRASLLPGADRPAVLWRLRLDADGQLVDTAVERALVRSRRKLSYAEAQRLVDGGVEGLVQLRVVGLRRLAIERARGGVSLPLPDQVVRRDGHGFRLEFRAPLPVESWNAQLSLLCGMAAAHLMLESGSGLLRTLPPAGADARAVLRRQADALGLAWTAGESYADVVNRLDPTRPQDAAFTVQATRLFRGAGYQPLGTSVEVPPNAVLTHGAIASAYAHVTAPLRRLGDRFATEAVLHAVAGTDTPDWVVASLEVLPGILQAANGRASALDRAVVDLVETLVLADAGASVFTGVVVDHRRGGSVVQLAHPAVVSLLPDVEVALGSTVEVRVAETDLDAGRTTLALA